MKTITARRSAKSNQWYITIHNKRNGKIVADGAEGYASKYNARRAVTRNFADGYTMRLLDESDDHLTFDMVPVSVNGTRIAAGETLVVIPDRPMSRDELGQLGAHAASVGIAVLALPHGSKICIKEAQGYQPIRTAGADQ